MNDSIDMACRVLQLRALVLALGETSEPAWWRSSFTNATGLSFMERLYPRSAFHAAVHAAGKAAAEVHDRTVGRTGVYHLFRLTESIESDLHRHVPSLGEDFVESFRANTGQPDALTKMLGDYVRVEKALSFQPGAQRIGDESSLRAPEFLDGLATLYLQGFASGKQVFPYFSSEKKGNGK